MGVSDTDTDIPEEYTPTQKRHTPEPTGDGLPAQIGTQSVKEFQLIEFAFTEGGQQYWFAAEFDQRGTPELRLRNAQDPDTTWKIPAKWLESSRFTPCTVTRETFEGEREEAAMVGYDG